MSNFELRVAWLTTSGVVGSLVLGVGLGATANAATMSFLTPWLRTTLAASIAVTVICAGTAWWGRSVARLAGIRDDRRVARFSAMIVGPCIVGIGAVLSVIEPILVARSVSLGVPIHVMYAMAFVPAALVIGTCGGLALGLGANDVSLALRLMFRVGLVAAAAFLVVDVVMVALGWRVGEPDAARRATMLVVTALGATAAALAGGFTIGLTLAGRVKKVATP